MEPVVTVGLDGSPESLAAARWAAGEARLRHLTLRLMHAWVLLTPEAEEGSVEDEQNYWAKRIVHDAQRELHQRYPDLPLTLDLVADEAGAALLGAAAESRMVVVGSRGLEPLESFFLGDTSLYVVARSDRPVVLVRAGMAERGTGGRAAGGPGAGAREAARPEAEPAGGTPGAGGREREEAGTGGRARGTAPAPAEAGAGEAVPTAATGGVVVGLSLHGPCDGLLEFALDAAAARGGPLFVVHGRSLPAQSYAPWGVDPSEAQKMVEDARRGLAETLRPWRDKFPGVRIVETVRLESPARAVVRTAAGADLLVIGRRRHRPALLPRVGPVAQAVIHHAACPVAVVPHD